MLWGFVRTSQSTGITIRRRLLGAYEAQKAKILIGNYCTCNRILKFWAFGKFLCICSICSAWKVGGIYFSHFRVEYISEILVTLFAIEDSGRFVIQVVFTAAREKGGASTPRMLVSALKIQHPGDSTVVWPHVYS